jgi:hypothetical protein
MVKTVRSFALVAALSLSVAPSLQAERGGTNPRPRVATVDSLTTFEIITYTVLSYFGY